MLANRVHRLSSSADRSVGYQAGWSPEGFVQRRLRDLAFQNILMVFYRSPHGLVEQRQRDLAVCQRRQHVHDHAAERGDAAGFVVQQVRVGAQQHLCCRNST